MIATSPSEQDAAMTEQPQPPTTPGPMPWDQPDKPSRPKGKTPWWAYAVVLAVVAVIGLCVARAGNGKSDPTPEDKQADAKRACQEKFVADRLKAPATAKYSSVTVSGAAGSYTVAGAVDSQNAFGALVRASFTCSVHLDGDQWVLDSAAVSG